MKANMQDYFSPNDMKAITYYSNMCKMTPKTPHVTLFMLRTRFYKQDNHLEARYSIPYFTTIILHFIAFIN